MVRPLGTGQTRTVAPSIAVLACLLQAWPDSAGLLKQAKAAIDGATMVVWPVPQAWYGESLWGTSQTWNQFHSIALGTVLQNIPPPFVAQSMTETAPGRLLRSCFTRYYAGPQPAAEFCQSRRAAICDFALHSYVGWWIRPCRDGSTLNI